MKNNLFLTKIFLLLCLFYLTLSCNVEKRIHDYSYTEFWYFEKGQRYQVYKTKRGRHYIIIVNKRINLERKYIKL